MTALNSGLQKEKGRKRYLKKEEEI